MNKERYFWITVSSVPGLGQFFNDEAGKGFLFLVGYILSGFLGFVFIYFTSHVIVAALFLVIAFGIQI